MTVFLASGGRRSNGSAPTLPTSMIVDGSTITSENALGMIAMSAIANKVIWVVPMAGYFPSNSNGGCPIGSVLYAPNIGGVGGVDKALATDIATARIAGICSASFRSFAPASTGSVIVDPLNAGMLDLTDAEWGAIIDGGGALVPNSYYYVSPNTPGNITAAKPAGSNVAVRVGLAVTKNILSIQIGGPP
jgi:hypothetical protein